MRLPFSAVVGQDTAKRALLLAATQPLLAGVLLRGDKGSAKTTLARGLAALLPGDAPFVELPLGATEERVIGSIDLAALLERGEPRFRPGLLASAHGGVLYVDEINLLADHLVDALLDVAASGVNRVERDGFSHTHRARFVLVASMNPEEGELRPQLLDRFGLAVDVTGLHSVADRVEAVRRQLRADAAAPPTDDAADAAIRSVIALAGARPAGVPDDVIEVASRLAVAVDAEGLRADLMLCRAAAASAALDGRRHASVDDVRAVADLVLGHRRRRRPFDEPGISQDELNAAWDAASSRAGDQHVDHDTSDATAAPNGAASRGGGRGSNGDDHAAPGAPTAVALPPAPPRGGGARDGRSSSATGFRGRHLRDVAHDGTAATPIDARATAVAAVTRRGAADPATRGASRPDTPARVAAEDLRGAVRERQTGTLVVFVVDASGSMGVEARMATTKAAILGLLGDAYRRRGRVALVTFRGEGAEVVLRPTGSIEIAKARLTELATGGATPLAAGLDAATAIVGGSTGDQALAATVVVVTDGRATAGGPAPVEDARASMERLANTHAHVLVIDTERGATRLGLAAELAVLARAEYRHLDDLGHDGLETWLRSR